MTGERVVALRENQSTQQCVSLYSLIAQCVRGYDTVLVGVERMLPGDAHDGRGERSGTKECGDTGWSYFMVSVINSN